MFLHEFGDHFVLALELGLQGGDPLVLGVGAAAVGTLEDGGAVLEELLLPGVEEGGLEVVLVADVGDGHPVDEVASEEGDLLGGGVVLAGLAHGRISCKGCTLTQTRDHSISV
jgi:hypothetical protein